MTREQQALNLIARIVDSGVLRATYSSGPYSYPAERDRSVALECNGCTPIGRMHGEGCLLVASLKLLGKL